MVTITLADLLSMKSGMPQPTEAPNANYWQAMSQWCGQEANAGAIGQEYEYNNNNYAILQGVIEYLYQHSTGIALDYVSIVQQSVLGPTGVNGIVSATPLPSTLTYNSQNLTDHNAGYEWPNFVAWMAAGGWIGSALDLTTFMAGVMNYQVVSETTLQTLMSDKYGFLVSGTMSNGVVYYGMNGLLYTGGNEPAGLNTAVQYFPQIDNGPAAMIVSLLINTTNGPGGGELWQPAAIWTAYNQLYNTDLPAAEISRPPIRVETSAATLM